MASCPRPDIILNSPVGSKPAVYKWPLTYTSKGQKIDGAEEIIETIRWVAREYLEFKPAIENLLPEQPDMKSYDCIKTLCDKYNKITDFVMKMNKGTSVALKTSSRASNGLLKHIIQQVYNYAVDEPNELNKYSPFSSETYGETSFEFMAQLIDRNQFKPREQDIFIDLGSGVGHLVLQMAASVKCKKCYGIEIADRPAGYAKKMEERFKFWMNWHGKTYTEFELFHGDFFAKKYIDTIRSATYILVNNFAFKPDDDHKLKQKFLDLKDGTQILSSKPFCSPKNRVTERHLSDIGSIMQVIEIQPELKKDTVSWTPKPLPYYLHVLDSSRLQRYYERRKRRQGKSGTEKGKPTKRRKTGVQSESYSDESDDNTVYGPTTRKAWSEWCNASTLQASNRTSTDSGKTLTSGRNSSTDTENTEGLNEEENTSTLPKPKENEQVSRREKAKNDTLTNTTNKNIASSVDASSPTKNGQNSSQAPKSCLDKKRDYAIKKNGEGLLQNVPGSTLYSISKPAESNDGTSSAAKIPSIVIKVKPPTEAKVVEKTSNENLDANAKKTNEGVKKLRQRKKSNQSDETTSTTSKKSSSSKTGAKTNEIVTTKPIVRRPRKSVGGKAGVKGANATNKKVPSLTDKAVSLDLLHAKTIESVSGESGFYPQPAPGCENFDLHSITNTPSLPKVVIKDPSMFVSSFINSNAIDRYLERVKLDIENFLKKVQQPSSREILLKCIEQERMRKQELIKLEEDLSKHIKFLNNRIPKAMRVHCDELGVKNSPKCLVQLLGSYLKKHQDLQAYAFQLEASLQPNQRVMNPPAAHSNSNQNFSNSYRDSGTSATLDLSLKQAA